ncbi:hypothetical protein BGZ73_007305 [Actinomortierella ambigua]|nr:hypothetical protein BGZ73_007305 [Actinomortierella ambigua]
MEMSKYGSRGPRIFSPLVLFNDIPTSPTALTHKEGARTLMAREDTSMDLDIDRGDTRDRDEIMGDDNDTITPHNNATALHTRRASHPLSPSSSPSPLDEHHAKQPRGGSQATDIVSPKQVVAVSSMTPPSSYVSASSAMDALAKTLAPAPDNNQQRIQIQRKKVQHMLDQNSLLWWELVRYTRTVERIQRERDLELGLDGEREREKRRRHAVSQVAGSMHSTHSSTFERANEFQEHFPVGSNNFSPSQDYRLHTSVPPTSSTRPRERSPSALSPTEVNYSRDRISPRPTSPVPLTRPRPTYPARASSPPQHPHHPYPYHSNTASYGYRSSEVHTDAASGQPYSEEQNARPDYYDDRFESIPRRGRSEEYPSTNEYNRAYGSNESPPDLRPSPSSRGNVSHYSPSSRPHAEDTMAIPRHQYHASASSGEHPSSATGSLRPSPYASPYGEESAPLLKHETRSFDHRSSPYSRSRDGSEGHRSLSRSPRLHTHPSPPPSLSLHAGSRPPQEGYSPLHEHHQHRQQQAYRPMPQPSQHHHPQLLHQQQHGQNQSQSQNQNQGQSQNQSQHNQAGRRRRGNLPKTVTTVLKAWLVDNATHPYPTEDEKIKLSQKTGLTLNQISNWFINARRRILQPILVEAAAAAVAGTDEPMDQVTIVRKGKGSRMLVEVEGGHHSQQQQQQQQNPLQHPNHQHHQHHHTPQAQEAQQPGSAPSMGDRRPVGETEPSSEQ